MEVVRMFQGYFQEFTEQQKNIAHNILISFLSKYWVVIDQEAVLERKESK